jgi:septal ring factor EnvC (AmiA/AmiB activator)
LALPSAVVALGLLFFLIALIQNTSAEIASIRAQLDATGQLLQQKIEQKQNLTENIAQLEKKIAEAQTSGGDFAAAVASLQKQTSMVNGNLEATVNSLSRAITLTSIAQDNPTLTITGSAPSDQDILSYVKQLDASGQFSHITITSLKRVADQRMDFTLVLSNGE